MSDKKYATAIEQRIADQIDGIADSLEQAGSNISVLQERLFVRIFLPFFCGEEVQEKEKIMQAWINTAGGQYKPIDVVNEKGEVIYRVPPLFDREAWITNIPNHSQPALSDVATTAQQLANVSPRRAQAYLDNELNSRGFNNKKHTLDLAIQGLIQWNAIFERYGKPKITIPGMEEVIKTTPSGEGQKSDGKVDIVYGDDDLL